MGVGAGSQFDAALLCSGAGGFPWRPATLPRRRRCSGLVSVGTRRTLFPVVSLRRRLAPAGECDERSPRCEYYKHYKHDKCQLYSLCESAGGDDCRSDNHLPQRAAGGPSSDADQPRGACESGGYTTPGDESDRAGSGRGKAGAESAWDPNPADSSSHGADAAAGAWCAPALPTASRRAYCARRRGHGRRSSAHPAAVDNQKPVTSAKRAPFGSAAGDASAPGPSARTPAGRESAGWKTCRTDARP